MPPRAKVIAARPRVVWTNEPFPRRPREAFHSKRCSCPELTPSPAPRRLAHAQGEEAEHHPGSAGQVEGGPPAVVLTHVAAQEKAEGAAHRNRHVEEGQHAAAGLA